MANRWTVASIARRNSEAGRHYFDRDTLRFFNQTRRDFRVAHIAGRVFVYGQGRDWGGEIQGNPIRPWSVAEFYPETGYTHTVDAIPDSLTFDRNTTAAQIRLALRAVAESRVTCPTANGTDLEIWEAVKDKARELAEKAGA